MQRKIVGMSRPLLTSTTFDLLRRARYNDRTITFPSTYILPARGECSMTDHQRRLWQTKLIFLLHDPADKALGIAGHEKRALSSIQAMLGKVDPKLLS